MGVQIARRSIQTEVDVLHPPSECHLRAQACYGSPTLTKVYLNSRVDISSGFFLAYYKIIMNICFIGGGNMSSALLGGLLQQGYSPAQIGVVEINAEQRNRIKRQFDVEATGTLAEGIANSSQTNTRVIVLAIKPQQLSIVARELAPLLSDHLVISIAAGIRAKDISRWMGGYGRVVRAMPNTPALIRAAVTGLYALPGVDEEGRVHAETILGAVGSVLWCEQEELLDAVTAVSGSGPAYVFYFIEAMQQAGHRARTEHGPDTAVEHRNISWRGEACDPEQGRRSGAARPGNVAGRHYGTRDSIPRE